MGLRLCEMTTVVVLACAIGYVERRCEISLARVPRGESRVHVVRIGQLQAELKAELQASTYGELADICVSSYVSWLSRTAGGVQVKPPRSHVGALRLDTRVDRYVSRSLRRVVQHLGFTRLSGRRGSPRRGRAWARERSEEWLRRIREPRPPEICLARRFRVISVRRVADDRHHARTRAQPAVPYGKRPGSGQASCTAPTETGRPVPGRRHRGVGPAQPQRQCARESLREDRPTRQGRLVSEFRGARPSEGSRVGALGPHLESLRELTVVSSCRRSSASSWRRGRRELGADGESYYEFEREARSVRARAERRAAAISRSVVASFG
jgi:hypothetical protein